MLSQVNPKFSLFAKHLCLSLEGRQDADIILGGLPLVCRFLECFRVTRLVGRLFATSEPELIWCAFVLEPWAHGCLMGSMFRIYVRCVCEVDVFRLDQFETWVGFCERWVAEPRLMCFCVLSMNALGHDRGRAACERTSQLISFLFTQNVVDRVCLGGLLSTHNICGRPRLLPIATPVPTNIWF